MVADEQTALGPGDTGLNNSSHRRRDVRYEATDEKQRCRAAKVTIRFNVFFQGAVFIGRENLLPTQTPSLPPRSRCRPALG